MSSTIKNPRTGRMVSTTGSVGKLILFYKEEDKKDSAKKKPVMITDADKILQWNQMTQKKGFETKRLDLAFVKGRGLQIGLFKKDVAYAHLFRPDTQMVKKALEWAQEQNDPPLEANKYSP